MRKVSPHLIRFVILLTLFLWWGWAEDFVFAQELTLSGVGPINHSLAGAAVALPRDSAGAMQWNPATISFLEKSEFQLGFGRHNAPWYGDEYAAGTIGIGVLVIGWLYLASTSDDSKSDLWDWEHRREQGNVVLVAPHVVIDFGTSDRDVSRPRQEPKSEDDTPKGPRKSAIRVPTISYVYQRPDSRWSFGLAVSEYGARKVGSVAIDDMVGICEYRFQGYEFIPTVAYRESKRFSVGVSPIFSIDETPNATLPIIPHLAGTPLPPTPQNQRGRAGFGFQFGAFYTPIERLRFGASLRTPQWIEGFTYRWTDPVTDEIGTRHLSFSQDSAFRIAVGTSYTLRNDATTLAADFRYSDYSHASKLYDIPASFDPNVKRLGISRAVYSLALGVEHRPRDIIAFRMGYQWNHAVSPNKAVIYNTSLPIQSGHSIHYGVTCFFSDWFDLSLSISNAFGGGWETFQTEDGPIRFRRNPNRSNFWIAGRLRF